MNKYDADKIISSYVKKLFGFAMSKLSKIDEAEELAAEITIQVYESLLKQDSIENPDAVCINLGCGLDDRFSRVDNGRILWYDIDLPDSIEVRSKAYEDTERRKMLAGNALESGWTEQIEKRKKALVVAEGLLMYFSKEQVQTLLTIIKDNFGDSVIICELMHPMVAANSDKHDTVRDTNAKFGWGTKSGEELVPLCDGLKLIREISLNEIMKKYTVRGFMLRNLPLANKLNNRIWVS